MPVEFKDFSVKVKEAITDETIAWLIETAGEVASQAKRNCSTEGWNNDELTKLKDGYTYMVDDAKGVAKVGNPLEMSFWEEFGKKFLCRTKIGQNRLKNMCKYGIIYP